MQSILHSLYSIGACNCDIGQVGQSSLFVFCILYFFVFFILYFEEQVIVISVKRSHKKNKKEIKLGNRLHCASTNCINYCPLEKSRRYIPAKSIYNSCHCVPLKCNIACPEMQLLSFLLWRKVGRCIKSPLTRERKSFKFNALVSTSLTKVAYLWQCWELWSMGGIK